MQKQYFKHLICFCMAAFFAIAVIGSMNGIESAPNTSVLAPQGMFCERNIDRGVANSFRPVSILEKMDDFQTFTNTSGTNLNFLAGLRAAAFVILAIAVFWYFRSIFPKTWIYFAERRIRLFRMAVFIHRFDGKKRACFETMRKDQNRRLLYGSGDKI